MIDGNEYIKVVREYFSFLTTEFDFKLTEEIVNGSFFYRIRYEDKTRAVTISYEDAEDYLSVFISILQNCELPDYDDKTQTLHLNRLNAVVLSTVDKSEIRLNNEYFLKFQTKDELERKLLKSAKELRLCLKHFNELQIV